MLKAGHSSTASESTLKPRAIKFSDPFVSQPAPPRQGVHRSHTVGVGSSRFPRPAGGSTINVKGRPLVGKVPPGAQFEMVSPPRSPKDTSPPKGSRLPLRAKSVEPFNGMRRAVTVTRGLRRDDQGPNTTAIPLASRTGSSMLSLRRDPLVMGWTESQATFRALTGGQPLRNTGRRALPPEWTTGAASQKSDLHSQPTTSTTPPDPTTDAERQRANSEPKIQPGASYPQLTSKERVILVRKLRMLLQYVGIEDQAPAMWERSSVKEHPTGNPGSVFGRSVKDSSPYASCQVVLGEHSHSLPICVFASVEQICQRGIATPGLFRVAPPPTERTVEKLTRAFDQGPFYGARISLAKEDTSNICALLKLYLRGLPEAVLSSALWSTVQKLTLVRNNDAGTTSAQIAAMQAILHLHHPTSFSLLVYLLAFMHQLVLHGSQNGLTIPILAGIFGPALFSPRKGNSARTGCVVSPPPKSRVLVKTFQSARDMAEGTRVMTWVLEHWDGIATGLLSLDIVHGSEKDIPAWEANLLKGSLGLFRGNSDGQYSEGPSIDEIVDPTFDSLVEISLPGEITVDRVPVREVRNCIVEPAEVRPLHSTRASSPATLWSQETGPNPAVVSRTASLATAQIALEPIYIQELRRRMDNQETELADLRQELALIRSRFVFPLPPNDMPQEIQGNGQVDKLGAPNADMDEDKMATPRPPSGRQCLEFQTMSELIDSLDSKPVTPLFHKTLTTNIPDTESDMGGTHPTSPTDDAEQSGETSNSSTASDSGIDTPPNEPSHGTLCIVNANPDSGKDVELANDAGKLQELLTARDALRSALAAMDPVRAQLKAVEEELEHRGEHITG